MKRALDEFDIVGLKTTKPLHLALLMDDGVRKGQYHTGYLEEHLARIMAQ
jgi:acetyl-CoA carboxylase biotin carboxylase subunit